jgi:hypothetical protein
MEIAMQEGPARACQSRRDELDRLARRSEAEAIAQRLYEFRVREGKA